MSDQATDEPRLTGLRAAKLAPGMRVKYAGRKWVVDAWRSINGERLVHLSRAYGSITARVDWVDLWRANP